LAVAVERAAKYLLAACFYYFGLTGLLLGKLLRRGESALILGYHGVTESSQDIIPSGHSLDNLAALFSFLGRHLRAIPLESIASSVSLGEAPPAGFAVTFDDGLVNNLTLALPLLQSLGIPATFFVPSALVGATKDLWVTTLTEMIRAWPGDRFPAVPGLWQEQPLGSTREQRR